MQVAIYVMIAGILAEVVLSVGFSGRLGDKVATRFGLDGKPYGLMSKRVAMWMGPVAALIVGIILLLPGGRNLGRSQPWISMAVIQVLLLGMMGWLFQKNQNTR